MKTKELIRRLQEADPSGEIECCIGNADIHFLSREPAYYDGALNVYQREGGQVVGVKRTNKGEKIQIQSYTISDLLLDDPNLPVSYEGVGPEMEKRYREHDEKAREESRQIEAEIISSQQKQAQGD